MLIPVHPSATIIDAAFTAFRVGRHIETIDGRVYMAPGRNTKQVIKAFKARKLSLFAASLAK